MAKQKSTASKQTKPRYPAPPPGHYELVPADTIVIKKQILQEWKRKQRELDRQNAILQRHYDEELPAFQRWMHITFGPQLADLRENHEKIREKTMIIDMIEDLSFFAGISARKLYQTLKGQESLERPLLSIIADYRDKLMAKMEKEDEDEPDDDHDFDDETEDDIFDELEELFGFGEDVEDEEPIRHGTAQSHAEHKTRLRDLYRKLCLKLHPDTGGKFTPETEKLWHQTQEAYAENDLERLESIMAGMELQLDPLSPRVSCSQLIELCEGVENSLFFLKMQIDDEKENPAWNFSKWTDKQRKRAVNGLKEEFRNEHFSLNYEMQRIATVFEQWGKPYRKKRRK